MLRTLNPLDRLQTLRAGRPGSGGGAGAGEQIPFGTVALLGTTLINGDPSRPVIHQLTFTRIATPAAGLYDAVANMSGAPDSGIPAPPAGSDVAIGEFNDLLYQLVFTSNNQKYELAANIDD